jgi:hypothetical protein
MQEPGNGRAAGDGELKLTHPARQTLSRFFIGTIRQRLSLLCQFIPFKMRVCGNGVKISRVQPVLAAQCSIFFLVAFCCQSIACLDHS